MKRILVSGLVLGLTLTAAVAMVAAAAPAPAPSSQPQADLAWFVTGLRDLAKSRDARLKLLPAQAKKILPVLAQLAAEKILITEIQPRQDRTGRRPSEFSGGQQGGFTEKQRQELQARQRKTAERVRAAIGAMDGMLRQAQSDYIINLDFDAAALGLDRMRVGQGQGQSQGQGQGQRPSQAEIQKTIKARQEAQERLVKLNREVLETLKKLAGGK